MPKSKLVTDEQIAFERGGPSVVDAAQGNTYAADSNLYKQFEQ